MRNVGGPLDYATLAQMHRPKTAEALRREVQRLAQNGLTPNDIGSALKMSPASVRELLVATPDEAVRACAEVWQR